MKENNNQKEDFFIKNAICSYVILNLDSRLTDEQFFKIVNFIDPKTIRKIPDSQFLTNERLKRFINYDKLDRRQVIRLMSRDLSIFERINIEKCKFAVGELEFFLSLHPHLVRKFNFDLQTLTGKDTITLLKADLNYIYEINLKDSKFTRLDFQDMIHLFANTKEVMNEIDFETLDNFLIRELILITEKEYLNKLDLTKLNTLDWLEILKKYPSMVEYCNLQLFESGDYFKLAQLVCMIPELDYLIDKNYDKLSALAWEKLLLYDPNKYENKCNYTVFKEINWNSILKKKPYLLKFKMS